MNSTKSTFTFLSLVSLIIHIAAADTPLNNICSSKNTYTKNSPYASNLNNLFTLLSKRAPPTGGFDQASIGKAQNKVNGLALCRGDVSSSSCTACITEASKTILSLCPKNKEAIIWYDNCMLKYSNLHFFGQIDNRNKFNLYNTEIATHPKAFNKHVKGLLSKLANTAQKSNKFYAIGDVKLGISDRLYGLTQCSRDVTSSNCKKCIDDAIRELVALSSGNKGGRIVGGSCNVRYELSQFAGNIHS